MEKNTQAVECANSIAEFDADQFLLPTRIDDRDGVSRVVGINALINDDKDVDAIISWLMPHADSPETFNSYRREAERLWLWITQIKRKPLSSLTNKDLMAYRAFMATPPPSWINTTKLPRTHKAWRPFAGPLNRPMIQRVEHILNGMFSFLVKTGYLASNPYAKTKNTEKRTPPINPKLVNVPTRIRLPLWMVEWLDEQDTSASKLVEVAIRRQYKIKPPI